MADRRAQRTREARRQILDAAWALADRDGIAGLSLRELARQVGMKAPSLYNYFESKDALYDALFVDGNQQLGRSVDEWLAQSDEAKDPTDLLAEGAQRFIRFCQESVARYQILFTQAVPGWRPSEEAYTYAVAVYERTADLAARAGIVSPEDLDLYTAISSGLAAQQIANDPTGDRWVALAPRAIRMLIGDIRDRQETT